MPANHRTTRKLVIQAMMIAMFLVLEMLSVKAGNIRITLESLPIVLSSALIGPVSGLTVGLTGSLLKQLLSFGLTPTTILWILPAGVRGLIVGLFFKKKNHEVSIGQSIAINVIAAPIVTLLNTLALYIDSKLYHYYTPTLIYATLVERVIIGILTGALVGLIVPSLVKAVKRSLHGDL